MKNGSGEVGSFGCACGCLDNRGGVSRIVSRSTCRCFLFLPDSPDVTNQGEKVFIRWSFVFQGAGVFFCHNELEAFQIDLERQVKCFFQKEDLGPLGGVRISSGIQPLNQSINDVGFEVQEDSSILERGSVDDIFEGMICCGVDGRY